MSTRPSLKDLFYRFGNSTEHSFDELKMNFRKRMGYDTNIHICPYISFGNATNLYVKGRLLHNHNIQSSSEDEWWDNLLNMYKRFNSFEIKGAKMKVTYGTFEKEFYTDEDGYFGTNIELSSPDQSIGLWRYPELELIESPVPFEGQISSFAKVMVPPGSTKFGMISDIDDTVLQTNTTSLFKMVLNTVTNNSHSRLPFPGVAALYRALQQGSSGNEMNPVFYVSSSPWNLYDLLTDFMQINGIPQGPLFLKDYGFTHQKLFNENHGSHKIKKIKKVMDAFPDLKFILIGDSGQKDPEIYAEIVAQYPGRILAIYIRDVTDDKRDLEVETVFRLKNVDFVYSKDSFSAAQHAAEKGFINSEMLSEIKSEKEKDSVWEE